MIVFIIVIDFGNAFSQAPKRPKIALVLSGGGAKGFAHVGVIKVLEQEGIPIDIIVGTSMGSIVGGFYSLGYSALEIEKIIRNEDWGRMLTDDVNRDQLSQYKKSEEQRFIASLIVSDKYGLKVPQGVVNGQNIINLFSRLAVSVPANTNFTEFPIAFTCIGTNLETGKEMILDRGYLPTAIFSSMTIPGVFLPIEHDSSLMLDGGLVNNFPTNIAKEMGADIIIGVDIRNDLHSSRDIISIEQLMDQLINFYTLSKDSVNKSFCDLLIRPDISGFNAYSFTTSAVDTLIQRGMDAAYSNIEQIRELKEKFYLTDTNTRQRMVMPDTISISNITISGDYSLNEKLILDYFDLDIPGKYTPAELQDAIDKLYGLGFFKRVYFNMEQKATGQTLNLIIEEQPLKSINVGLRVNTTEAVSILFNFSQKDYRRFIGLISITADISSNPGLDVFTEFSKGKLPVLGLQINGKKSKYGVYYDKRKAFTTDLIYGSATAYTYKSLKKASMVGLGFKEEIYSGNIFNATGVDTFFSISKNQVGITSVYTYYSLDNLNDYYFPERGSELYAEFLLSSDPDYKAICPVAMAKNRNIFKLTSKSNILLNFYGRALLLNNIHPYKTTFVGGSEYSSYFNYQFPFYGLPSVTPANRYTLIGMTGVQFRFAKKQYVSFIVNCMLENADFYPFNEYSTTFGSAIKYSAKTRFGPVDFTAGFSGGYEKPVITANIGYWF
jgi:NTE family protein